MNYVDASCAVPYKDLECRTGAESQRCHAVVVCAVGIRRPLHQEPNGLGSGFQLLGSEYSILCHIVVEIAILLVTIAVKDSINTCYINNNLHPSRSAELSGLWSGGDQQSELLSLSRCLDASFVRCEAQGRHAPIISGIHIGIFRFQSLRNLRRYGDCGELSLQACLQQQVHLPEARCCMNYSLRQFVQAGRQVEA